MTFPTYSHPIIQFKASQWSMDHLNEEATNHSHTKEEHYLNRIYFHKWVKMWLEDILKDCTLT